jgi:hypothetical protein
VINDSTENAMNDHEKSPKTAEEQDSPAPERPITPDEEAGMDLAEMEHPPQAEGPRESVEDDRRDRPDDRGR